MPINNSTGITTGGTRYFTGFPFQNEQPRSSFLHRPRRRSRFPSWITRWLSTPPPRGQDTREVLWRDSIPCLFGRWSVPEPVSASACPGNSSTNRWLTAILSDASGRAIGNRAIIGASASAASAFGKPTRRAASSHGSTPSRVNAEMTLSDMPFCSSPIEAKRKPLRSEWSSENRCQRHDRSCSMTRLASPGGAARDRGARGDRQQGPTPVRRALQRAAEPFGAGPRNRGIWGASRHRCPAALFDHRLVLRTRPCSTPPVSRVH